MTTGTTVNVSGTWSEKQRHENGLNRVADFMDANRIAQVVVVGIAEWHSRGETKTGTKMSVSLVAIEPGVEADGTDPDGLGQQLRDILDKLRKRQGLASVEDTLFSAPRESFGFDGRDGEEIDGQAELPIRMGADGEHEVPEASGEELLAEKRERDAAAPAATFSGGTE